MVRFLCFRIASLKTRRHLRRLPSITRLTDENSNSPVNFRNFKIDGIDS